MVDFCDIKDFIQVATDQNWRCEEVVAIVGTVTVSAAGDIALKCPADSSINVTKTGTGVYEVTPPAGAISHTAVAAIVDEDSRDGIHAHFDGSFTQGTVWTGTGDNGGAPDILVDAPFTISWTGKRNMVVCD